MKCEKVCTDTQAVGGLVPCPPFTPLSPEVGVWLRDSEKVKDGGKGGGLVPEEEEEGKG